ncbi:phosphate ABC transporter substrate-binding protein (PhoT family) [Propionicimonas paludicola]|uniref:Phosphate ABC transporter substrate-binding protein (PhoT family) n=1 Tax=Propionicimonas paludicola TaxID=185243 RepID=A0A2A9CUM4_9ACTN|nr:substrate-binding domain-containing protein [Propionicimonas paludicola]PFG18098.1 phosphate ABC transporter substrate-binding protein (PhoT family) [Propionicimonas paludicola]
MRTRSFAAALVAALLAASLAACTPGSGAASSAATPPASPATAAVSSPGDDPEQTGSAPPATPAPGYPFALAGLPRIDGSTANIPLISLVTQRLTGVPATIADNAVKTTGTPQAYQNLVNQSTDLLLVYEADTETKRLIAESGTKLEYHPIGRDALVFFTNSSNPVKSLTTAQYKDIYTGKLTNWKQVGGKKAPIIGYQRPEASGSQALFRKYVVGDAKLAKAPADRISGEMGEIIDGVASYANSGNALGYSVYYYLANMYAVDGIKMLGVGGVQPTKETLADGSYPYTNDFFAVIRANEPADSPARKVLAWLLSADGSKAVADAGYVPAK